MKFENLHTSTLEKLYGPLKGDIISQNEKNRIIHLRDENNISRTLAVVRFINIEGQNLQIAHEKIVLGDLLGKTLNESNIAFEKKYIGHIQVKLPDSLKKEFGTSENSSRALFSKIWVSDSSLSNGKFLYSELIEIIPPEIMKIFENKTLAIKSLDKNLLDLLKLADLRPDTNIEET